MLSCYTSLTRFNKVFKCIEGTTSFPLFDERFSNGDHCCACAKSHQYCFWGPRRITSSNMSGLNGRKFTWKEKIPLCIHDAPFLGKRLTAAQLSVQRVSDLMAIAETDGKLHAPTSIAQVPRRAAHRLVHHWQGDFTRTEARALIALN